MGGLPLGCGNALESRYGASRYGGEEGFEQVLDLLEEAADRLLADIRGRL